MSNAGYYILHGIKCPYCGVYQPIGTPCFEILVDVEEPVKFWKCVQCYQRFKIIITIEVEKEE